MRKVRNLPVFEIRSLWLNLKLGRKIGAIYQVQPNFGLKLGGKVLSLVPDSICTITPKGNAKLGFFTKINKPNFRRILLYIKYSINYILVLLFFLYIKYKEKIR